jgi:hypothetical protein
MEGESVIWLHRLGLAAIGLGALSFLVVFYQQESATKYVMMEVPTVLVVVEIPPTPTRTATPTRTPTRVPTITPTPWPQYGVASPQPVMVVPKWTPTMPPASTELPEVLTPCAQITPDRFLDTFCEVAP